MLFGFQGRHSAVMAALHITIQQGKIIMSALDDLKAASTAEAAQVTAALAVVKDEAAQVSALTTKLGEVSAKLASLSADDASAELQEITAEITARTASLQQGIEAVHAASATVEPAAA